MFTDRFIIAGNPGLSHGAKCWPELVIRQDVPNSLWFVLLNSKLAYSVCDSSPIWEWFEPRAVQYLCESGSSLEEPPYVRFRDIKMIAIDPTSYKEYSKRADVETLYFPRYSKEELLAIGSYIRDAYLTDNFFCENFDEVSIESRYNLYGGVMQRVLPRDKGLLLQNQEKFNRAVSDALLDKVHELLVGDRIDEMGSYLVQWSSNSYVTSYGNFPFRKRDVHFSSEKVCSAVRSAIDTLTYEQLSRRLQVEGVARKTNENATAVIQRMYFRRFVMEHHKRSSIGGVHSISPDQPNHADMATGTIYHPINCDEAVFNAYYKDLDGNLVLIRCAWTESDTVCMIDEFAKFLSGISFSGTPSDIRVVYAHGYDETSEWKLDCSKTE
jgi:hypothetical protein